MSGSKSDKKEFGRHKGILTVEEGESRRPKATIEFEVVTELALGTIEYVVEPSVWMYRNTCGMLADSGFQGAITPINQLIARRISDAIAYATKTEKEMARAIQRFEGRTGTRVSLSSDSKPHRIKLLAAAGIVSKLIEMSTMSDKAAVAVDNAVACGALSFDQGFTRKGEIIAHNRLISIAITKMYTFTNERLAKNKAGKIKPHKVANMLINEATQTITGHLHIMQRRGYKMTAPLEGIAKSGGADSSKASHSKASRSPKVKRAATAGAGKGGNAAASKESAGGGAGGGKDKGDQMQESLRRILGK